MRLPDACVAPRKHELKFALKTALETKHPEKVIRDALIVSIKLFM